MGPMAPLIQSFCCTERARRLVTDLLTSTPPRVIDSKKHKDKHVQMYTELFLYVLWQDEETFLGEASRSEEAGQKKWDEWGESAKDLKKQLYRKIKESWLS